MFVFFINICFIHWKTTATFGNSHEYNFSFTEYDWIFSYYSWIISSFTEYLFHSLNKIFHSLNKFFYSMNIFFYSLNNFSYSLNIFLYSLNEKKWQDFRKIIQQIPDFQHLWISIVRPWTTFFSYTNFLMSYDIIIFSRKNVCLDTWIFIQEPQSDVCSFRKSGKIFRVDLQ